MPLQLDDAYRGPHAVHVHPHKKLGKHRTVIEEALPLINDLIDDDNIKRVDFGKMATAPGIAYEPRFEYTTTKRYLHLLLVSKTAAQGFTISVKDPTLAEEVLEHIKTRWGSITGLTKLRVV